MLKVRVIPCLDVKDGRVVKGVQFVSLRDAGDPVEQARAYDAAGADELMFLDITASHENRGTILDGRLTTTGQESFYPALRAEDDARAVLAVYQADLAVEAPAAGEWCVLNATDADRVVVLSSAPNRARVTIEDRAAGTARELEVELGAGATVLPVPAWGTATVRRAQAS